MLLKALKFIIDQEELIYNTPLIFLPLIKILFHLMIVLPMTVDVFIHFYHTKNLNNKLVLKPKNFKIFLIFSKSNNCEIKKKI